MKKKYLSILVFGVILFFVFTNTGYTATLVSEDFSNDPGWYSTNPTSLYWDSVNQAYFSTQIKPNDAASVIDLGTTLTGDFILEYDINITRADFDVDYFFGLGSNLDYVTDGVSRTWGTTNFAGGFYTYVASHNGGKRFDLFTTQGDVATGPGETVHWSNNTWYHNELAYDSGTKDLTLNIFSGTTIIKSHTLTNYDLDSQNLRYVGIFSRGYDNGFGVVEGLVDNVVLTGNTTAPVPEPSTYVLFGSGLLGLVYFRRKGLKG